MITLMGKKVSEGIAIGKLSFFKRTTKEIRQINVKDVEKEVTRLLKAKEKTQLELKELFEVASKEVGEANAAVFEVQQKILANDEYNRLINAIILEEKLNAEYAVITGTEEFLKSSIVAEDPDINNHHEDVKDVSSRIIRVLTRSWKDKLLVDDPFVLAADELYPSEAMQFDKAKVLGFVTKYGTINSHTAILARTKGIPSIIGLGEALKEDYQGKTIILDGFEGKVYIEPDYTTLTKMQNKKDANLVKLKNLERLKGKENITQSGRRIDVCANIGTAEDIDNVLRSDAGGIGLFRTEYLFMDPSGRTPTEEDQFQVYRRAAETMGAQPVAIRVADLGDDKQPTCMDLSEDSGFGYRGIRVLLDKEEMLMTQLRAILRASAYGNVKIVFPLITSEEEVGLLKQYVEKAKEALDYDKVDYNKKIQLGAMIETPAAVMLSGELARELDFFSIGTNDLTQFTLAVSRDNQKAAGYYQQNHPALLKMIRIVANNIHLEGKRISICGDMAADLEMTEFFIKIGIHELSVAPPSVLGLRKKIREIQ